MAPGRDTRKRQSELGTIVTPEARNVVRAFEEARDVAPGFLFSSGVLPELSESVTERLHRVVQYLGNQRFGRKRTGLALQAAIREAAGSPADVDRIEAYITALTSADTTAAYLLGLAVGLSIGAAPGRFRA